MALDPECAKTAADEALQKTYRAITWCDDLQERWTRGGPLLCSGFILVKYNGTLWLEVMNAYKGASTMEF